MHGATVKIVINIETSLRKVTAIFTRFECNFNYLDRFSKNTKMLNFMKIRPVRSRVIPCGLPDKQTDTKLIIGFRNFANAPKIDP